MRRSFQAVSFRRGGRSSIRYRENVGTLHELFASNRSGNYRHFGTASLKPINENVVVGYVENVKTHPNADRLRVCTVRIGNGATETQEIVCGADNISSGQYVPVALPGAKLQVPEIDIYVPSSIKKKSGSRPLNVFKHLSYKTLKIKTSTVRGQKSNGMVCSLRELGYSSKLEDGIWVIENISAEDFVGKPVPAAWVTVSSIEEERRSFQNVLEDWHVIGALAEANALLSWDQQVFMPNSHQNAESRGRQISTLSSLMHQISTSDKYEQNLNKTISKMHYCLNSYEQRSCEIALEDLEKAKSTPNEVVVELTKLQNKTFSAWARAKSKSKFSIVKPALEDLVHVSIEAAKYRRQPHHETLYSCMLSDFVKGSNESILVDIFSYIKSALVPLSKTIMKESPFAHSKNLLISEDKSNPFDIGSQKDLSLYVLNAMGFSESNMRVDTSAHPFTIAITPADDVRITSRFSPHNAQTGLYATIHEMGHALYEQNLNSKTMGFDTPLNRYLDLAAHESQSLFWERMIAQSRPFAKWLTPRLIQNLGYGTEIGSKSVNYDDIYRSVNAVSANLIRVEADEVHYPLHVLIRFEIERELINGSLEVKDLPEKWNHLYQEYLGLTASNESDGCLQDVHWFTGMFGYFPSYTLGAMYAAQLYRQVSLDINDVDIRVANGDFVDIRNWLKTHIHSHGAYPKDMNSLCKDITGEGLRPELFIEYLNNKYLNDM